MQEQFSLKSTIEVLVSCDLTVNDMVSASKLTGYLLCQLLSVQQTKMASSSASTFSATLAPRTPSLIRSILQAVAGAVPRSHLVSLSELLHACLLRLPEQSRPALKELLSMPGWPNERSTDEAKNKFEKSLLRFVTLLSPELRKMPVANLVFLPRGRSLGNSARTGRQVRQAVNDFALLSRGLDGSAYGAQTGM